MIRSEPGEPSPWDSDATATPASGIPVTHQVLSEPVVPVTRVYEQVPQAVVTSVPPERVYLPPEDRSPWVVIAAVVALLLGGLVGYLIGHSTRKSQDSLATVDTASTDTATAASADQRVNDIFTLLAAEARQPAGIQRPTPYPALDELLDALGAGAATTVVPTSTTGSADTSALTAERDQLKAQVADLQKQLTESQAALATAQQTLSTSSSATNSQAQLDQQAKQIATLQKSLDQANANLQTVQAQLAAASKTLSDLNPKPLDNQVGLDIAKVRATAQTNGWTLVEQPVESATATVGTVTSQSPAPGSTMIKGSVLYVEVAAAPGTTG